MEPQAEKDLQEIKVLVQQIADRLGIGATRPADVLEIRRFAKMKAEKIVNKTTRQR